MHGQLKRREFITLLGGAAATWPLVASAQQPKRMRRVGVLLPATADNSAYQPRLAAFAQGLQQTGWTIGRNLQIGWSRYDRSLSRSAKNTPLSGSEALPARRIAVVVLNKRLHRGSHRWISRRARVAIEIDVPCSHDTVTLAEAIAWPYPHSLSVSPEKRECALY